MLMCVYIDAWMLILLYFIVILSFVIFQCYLGISWVINRYINVYLYLVIDNINIKNTEKYINDTFLAFNGDVICSLDLKAIMDFHKEKMGMSTISMWEVEDPTRYGIMGIDSEFRVTRFFEKPKPSEVFSNWQLLWI